MRGLFSCYRSNPCLDPEYVEKLQLPDCVEDEEVSEDGDSSLLGKKIYMLSAPFSAKNTAKNRAQAQLMYSALWDRQKLRWDYKYLSTSLAELEKIFKALPKNMRIEWIVQALVMIKELKDDVHFRKILFLIVGLFLDTKEWPKEMNNLYTGFLRARTEEAERSIAEYCSDLNKSKSDTDTTASTAASETPFVRDFARKMAAAMRDPFEASPSKRLQTAEFEGIAWAYELLHICEYKLRDFLTKDETLKDKKKNLNLETMERAKPVLLELHDGEGHITYRRKDVDTSAGFKESLLASFELHDVPESADLYEVFCDAHKTVQKVPFSHESSLLKQCADSKMRHFHYYVYKPHCVDFLDNLGEKVKPDEGSVFADASYYFGMKKAMGGGILKPPNYSRSMAKKLVRFRLISEDLMSTYSSKYSDVGSVHKEPGNGTTSSMFEPISKRDGSCHRDGSCASCGTTSSSVLGEGVSVLPTPIHIETKEVYRKKAYFSGANTCDEEEDTREKF